MGSSPRLPIGLFSRNHAVFQKMDTLHGKPVLILTAQGVPISMGRVEVIKDPLHKQVDRAELVFETETMGCRLRIPAERVAAFKQTWDGKEFRYTLPGGDQIWARLPITGESEPD